MARLILRNDQYRRIEAMLPDKASDVGRQGQSFIRRRAVGRAHRLSLAGFAGSVRPLEQHV